VESIWTRDPKAAKTVVISHFHGDHISGLSAEEGMPPGLSDRAPRRGNGARNVLGAFRAPLSIRMHQCRTAYG
jgi:glyoxylase-like metal-dependent hydrolase (beta-lactamase superfamily II)